jgi:hypothetical protein
VRWDGVTTGNGLEPLRLFCFKVDSKELHSVQYRSRRTHVGTVTRGLRINITMHACMLNAFS